MKRTSLLLFVLLTLAACSGGGGGGGDSGTPPIPPLPNLTPRTIGGTVSGMLGSGMVLTNNGGDAKTINAIGPFTFNTALFDTFPYSVQVQTQPSVPAQTCTVANGSGTIAGSNITGVQVDCKNTVGGTISGASFSVVLQNNGGDNLTRGNGSFTFPSALPNGTGYNVTVLSSSPTQQCTVTNGTGTANGNVTNVQIVCKDTIGGTISGLAGTVVLQNNGGDDLQIVNTNGPFVFATAINNATAYNVTVLTQPSSPAQTCTVANGSGTAGGNITGIQINCTNGQWTWIKGANLANQTGTYGTKGVAAPNNTPSARFGSSSWTDASGNLWLFGGFGLMSDGISSSYLNELWTFSGGQWTWVNGTNTTLNPPGTYGTRTVAAAANVPGGRIDALSWTDGSSNLWLFGGEGFDSAGMFGRLNDLWKFNGTQWTWVSGATTRDPAGVCTGPAANLVPGARHSSVGWIDASGDLWLFGGQTGNSLVATHEFNDLWKYTVLADRWTFVGGCNTVDSAGTFGTKGVAAVGNVPSGRSGSVSWKDAGGNMWLFGGFGCDSSGCVPTGDMNDLWKFDGALWTWVNGSNVHDQPGVYGTLGTGDPANVPGARSRSARWTEGGGNLWLFGGQGSAGVCCGGGDLTDLWKYTISTGNWTWASGSNLPNLNGTYGAQGAVAVGFPGSRNSAASWIDLSGDLWLFGGAGHGALGTSGSLNDLWRFKPQ